MTDNDKFVRAGDVDVIPIESTPLKRIPKEAKPIASNILAYGEATGHNHSIKGKAQVLQLEKPIQVEIAGETTQVEKFLHVEEQSVLTHQEHDDVIVEPGDYIIPIEREYDPFEQQIKKVMD